MEVDKELKKIFKNINTSVLSEHYFNYTDAITEITTLLNKEVVKARIDELEHLRSRYTALTWGHYDPFNKIDERLATLKADTRRKPNESNK